MGKIKVGIVNYLNTKPLLFGIEHSAVSDKIEWVMDYPAHIADLLTSGAIDLGLVPVATLPRLPEAHIVTDYCIGCNGPVASVALFSDVPLESANEVLLDYQSRSSVALTRILLREYWKLNIRLSGTSGDFGSRIKGNTAGLLIGDRALQRRAMSPYIFDLGEAWKNLTGLPFVFAAWVSNKVLDPSFIDDFNAANALGVAQIDKVVAETPCDYFNLGKYYRDHISYNLDANKRAGLDAFLERLATYANA